MAKNKSGLFSGNMAVREQARSVFKLILQSGPASRPMLLEHLDLPPTTLSRVLDRLTADGLITESGQADSTGGRPASLFSVNASARVMMGIAVRGEQCHLVLMDLLGQVINRSEASLADDPGSDDWLDSIVSEAVALAGNAPGGPAVMAGAGLILPDALIASIGPCLVDRIEASLNRPAAMTDEWSGVTAYAQMTRVNRTPQITLWIGDTVRLLLPESVRKPDMGANRPAITGFLVPDPLAEDTGALMPLEKLVAIHAVGERFAVLRDQSSLGYPDFLAALQLGKKKALRLMDATAEALAQTLVNIACVTGTNQFQLTGTLVESLPAIVDQIMDKTNRLGTRSGILISVDRLKQDPWDPAAGAAAWQLAQLLERPVHARGIGPEQPSA